MEPNQKIKIRLIEIISQKNYMVTITVTIILVKRS